MIKIKDAVDGVIDAMRLRGCSDYTLKEITDDTNKWKTHPMFMDG